MAPGQAARLVADMEAREPGASLGLLGVLGPVATGRLLEALAEQQPDLASRLLAALARGPRLMDGAEGSGGRGVEGQRP